MSNNWLEVIGEETKTRLVKIFILKGQPGMVFDGKVFRWLR